MNLYDELMNEFKLINKSTDDISFITYKDKNINIECFLNKAKKINYDNDYGIAYIQDLIIMFNDGTWLSRDEYNGSEWFVYNKVPVKPEHADNTVLNKLLKDD